MHLCGHCNRLLREDETVVREQPQNLPVLGIEDITITAKVRFCRECDTDIHDRELDDASLKQAYAIFRQRHNIPDSMSLPQWKAQQKAVNSCPTTPATVLHSPVS